MDIRECLRQASGLRDRIEHLLAVGQDEPARRLVGEFTRRIVPGLTSGQVELQAWLTLLTRMIAPETGVPEGCSGQAWLWPELAKSWDRQVPAGLAGPAGPAGPKGLKGPKGSKGLKGPKGLKGSNGLKGPAATDGMDGVDRGDGADGTDWTDRLDESLVPERHRRGAAIGFVTQDPSLCRLLQRIRQMAPTDLPILIEGESGTGKELLARAAHLWSRRHGQPSVALNCGAMPPQLQESELFGHARGAYTGATMEKPGLFEAAHQGTLFLDEVGEMDTRAQVKLLRVLENGELRRLGEVQSRQVDVRIVSATNADLATAVDEGRFRKDLLYRLGAVRLRVPPLRKRRGDILPLAEYFLHRALPLAPPLTPAARQALVRHSWPGNVRELRFAMLRAVAIWREAQTAEIGEELLFPEDMCVHACG